MDYVPVLFSLNIDFESSTKSFFKRYCNPAEILTLILFLFFSKIRSYSDSNYFKSTTHSLYILQNLTTYTLLLIKL